ncbi:MAG TPA: RdgB/HAM1 family non-canonical purine NTP pyrophosphatase [Candidatus Methylomirabilis sp.]|nr:RdgB/HAM1 family non-canonical purine NTP pyrophosphatase [Candidatus Methylomirabilis sp.]
MKLVFATHNQGKIKEMKKILAGLPWEILSASEAGVTEEPVEDGATFADNALLKAKFVADKVHEWTVADDSGLCVEALNGAPGVFSARWAGENATGEEKAEKVLRELGDTPEENRGAYFESSVALVAPDGRHWIFTGRVQGKITSERREKIKRPHLPYDAIFIPDNYEKTFGEMTDEEKNALSHRGQAFRKLKDFLLSLKLDPR